MDRLIQFMIEHCPHVCVVATAPGQLQACRNLKENIALVIGKILEDHARAIPEEVNTIQLHFIDDTVPALAASCAAMRTEFIEHSTEIRHAVALGRYIRNSAAVVAALAAGGEARALNLGPLQDALTPEEKMGIFERGLIDVINQCGVDVTAPWPTPGSSTSSTTSPVWDRERRGRSSPPCEDPAAARSSPATSSSPSSARWVRAFIKTPRRPSASSTTTSSTARGSTPSDTITPSRSSPTRLITTLRISRARPRP